jgi:hypothetical protein
MDKFQKNIDDMISKILKEEIEKRSEEKSEEVNEQWQAALARVAAPMVAGYIGKKMAEDEVEEQEEKPSKYYGSFDDEHGWYDDSDREHSGEFDFEYDEEEFDEFDPFYEKYGKETKWFAAGDEGKKFFDKYKKKYEKPFKVRSKRITDEQETEEGNAFSGALAKAREEGEDSFEVDGKKYDVKESVKNKETKEEEKWIPKDMKKGVLRKKLGVPEGEKIPKSKLKSLKNELMKKGEGDKKLSASDSKLLKQVNLALTLKDIKESKNTLTLSEDELINLIENIVKEQKEIQKVKDNIKDKTPFGLAVTEKNLKKSKEFSDENTKEVIKKMKDYTKEGSNEVFEMNPKHFPKNNGQLKKMSKKAYTPSKAVEEYIENLAYPSNLNLDYDEIKPNDEWLEKNLVGSSETGNNNDWANSEDTGLGKKFNKIRKDNLYGKEKKRSYNRVTQPVDEAGEGEGEGALDKMFAQLESTEDKKKNVIKEEMERMKEIFTYKQKTQ